MVGKFSANMELWGGGEGTPGMTILTEMCMHPPDEGAHEDMEGRCGGYR